MHDRERDELLSRLEAMTDFLEGAFGALSDADAVRPGPNGTFSPVEQCWHLADLEREGFGARIERLLGEDEPVLPDFDGDQIARDRNYRSRALADGLRSFRKARADNVARLRSVGDAAWTRSGTQEGVGRITLRDVPALAAAHDASHRSEIEAWLREGKT
jgi:hypothetical protein